MLDTLLRNLRWAIVLVACFFPLHRSMGQAVNPPNTTAGKLLAGWLDYMNANDESPASDFNPVAFRDKTEGAVRSRTELRNRSRELFGTLTIANILAAEDREIKAVLAAKNGRSILLTVSLAPKPNDLINSIKLEAYRGVDQTHSTTPQSDSEVRETANATMVRAAREGFSGAVLLARGPETLFAGAYGLANRSHQVPNTIETRFNLGSMNKMFTAVAIMQLKERNKLALTDPASKYLDESWLPKVELGRIQIGHLLSHTSGLGDYFNEKFLRQSRARYRDVSDYKALLSDEQLAFAPGSRWQYSNVGFLLLGAIIENVSGEKYDEYVRKNIYVPAGMKESGCFTLDAPHQNLAYGYWKEDGEWRNNVFLHVIKGGPAGGGYSTVQDLRKFSDALVSGKLLSRENTRELVTPKPKSPRYGYGFEIRQSPLGLAVGHNAGFPGIEAHFSIYLDKGVTLVVLCNTDDSMPLVLDDLRSLVGAVPKQNR